MEIEYSEMKPHEVSYRLMFSILEEDENRSPLNTHIMSEFVDKSPFKARQKAIDHYLRINDALMSLQFTGLLDFSDSNKTQGIKPYLMLFDGERSINLTAESYELSLAALTFEYMVYLAYGFETGETLNLKDENGITRTILPFQIEECFS